MVIVLAPEEKMKKSLRILLKGAQWVVARCDNSGPNCATVAPLADGRFAFSSTLEPKQIAILTLNELPGAITLLQETYAAEMSKRGIGSKPVKCESPECVCTPAAELMAV